MPTLFVIETLDEIFILECSGKGWKPIIRCSFEKDFCGFTQSGMVWVRSKGKKNNDKYPEIPYDEYLPGSYFVYPESTFLKEEYQKGEFFQFFYL